MPRVCLKPFGFDYGVVLAFISNIAFLPSSFFFFFHFSFSISCPQILHGPWFMSVLKFHQEKTTQKNVAEINKKIPAGGGGKITFFMGNDFQYVNKMQCNGV